MAGKTWITCWDSDRSAGYSDESTSIADDVFGFLEEQEESPNSSRDSIDYVEEDEDEISCSVDENRKFWETQNQLLQVLFVDKFIVKKYNSCNVSFQVDFFQCFFRQHCIGLDPSKQESVKLQKLQ